MSKGKGLIVLAAGGTGGHLFPAEAIAEKLKQNGYDIQLVCDKRVLSLLEGAFLKTKTFIITSIAPRSGIINKLINILLLFFSTVKISITFLLNRPKLIMSFGGYPTLPAALSAVIFRIPLILHEQNSSLGQINKLFLPFAKNLLISFPNTKQISSKYIKKVVLAGLPLRSKIITLINSKKPEKNKKLFKILVIGGSQGARIFSDVIPQAILNLDQSLQKKIQITQQTRNNLIDGTINTYKKTLCGYQVASFFKNIAELYQQHDLLIIRAGASSIAELMSFQKAAIVVPFAKAKDNHQYHNAKFLSDNSKIIFKEENGFSIDWLSNCLKDFLNDQQKIKNIETSYNAKYTSIHINAADMITNFITSTLIQN
ncbi:UDP-N-acetylglucosamine--N-acetylmuramyl-(pentapeptide) pyrophosphoryl-undecaprenol N-acetylglucosamine transferase [Candidatus Bandiella euplotis]|uniref:UDP-N-acetylglucosamine--N-acetylmuramyl-(pentapeptide) pyrophosphoryl-undecaprenol N-acetylglucosamine transferase n=1 Tax=Candidatus Bandiella euplotis TaxID=1664265 RepID=A0ABZ0UND4_9RICK|nr:UDP-N-acetylglucosamine--N-acetylmuramyl-(pentapeptide) pyrophosphoryl-undecaprenol N-acetylglucosamine transferase [Candidatus Bandiella woodruffii]WPX96479.1 UDP-N-acetylglucosamine--N-acetylmuramyl-(pentapeptide) pyrophosphoryl-undecaprenol N-acetylglucosamine transferase [Candidatus Bandiella woodruffii]